MTIIARLKHELNLDAVLEENRPVLDISSAKGMRWPRNLAPDLCVAVDPCALESVPGWPVPRFEILLANLDTVNLKTVVVGMPSPDQRDEKLMRAAMDFSGKKTALDQAHTISQSLMWIGHDTLWRHVAAAVGVPQIVIVPEGFVSSPVYEDTTIVQPGSRPAESTALGPLSVADVADVIVKTLKKSGHKIKRVSAASLR